MNTSLPTTFWGWVQYERSSLWDAAVKAMIAIVIIVGFWLFSSRRVRVKKAYFPLGAVVYAFAMYLFITLRPYFTRWERSFAETGWQPFMQTLFLGAAFLLLFFLVRLAAGWISHRKQTKQPMLVMSVCVWFSLMLMRLLETCFAYTAPKSAIEYHITEYPFRYWGAVAVYAVVITALLGAVLALPYTRRKMRKKCINCLAPLNPKHDVCPICDWGACQATPKHDILPADTRGE